MYLPFGMRNGQPVAVEDRPAAAADCQAHGRVVGLHGLVGNAHHAETQCPDDYDKQKKSDYDTYAQRKINSWQADIEKRINRRFVYRGRKEKTSRNLVLTEGL